MFRLFKLKIVWLYLILLIPVQTIAQTQWESNGISIASSQVSYVHTAAVPDGQGGLFLTYENDISVDIDIYAQWINSIGNPQWGESGVVVCSSGGDQKNPSIVRNSLGQVFIAWQDEISKDIYAQHLDSDGSRLGPVGGIPVCTSTGEQSLVKIVSDGADGAILIWTDKRNGSDTDLYGQRLDNTGNPLWTTNGMPVTTATGNQSSHAIIADGMGGTFIVWQDYRNGFSNTDIYAQHISSSGIQTWTTDGKAVVSQNENQYNPVIDTSSNKIIITWDDSRSSANDIYAQALDFSGNPLWTADGIPVSQADGMQFNSRIVHDGSGGVIICWADYRSSYDIYAQHIDENGTILWTANGIAVNQSSGDQYAPEMVYDGSGGAFIIWNDNRGSDIDLYSQHIDQNGNLLFMEEGVPIVTAIENQLYQVAVSDESGGSFVLWQDGRNSLSEIYGQLLNDNITFTAPDPGTWWNGTQSQSVQWTLRTTQTQFHHLSLHLSESPGDGYPHSIDQNIDPLESTYSWTPSTVSSSTVRVKIVAYNVQNSVLCQFECEEFAIDSEPPLVFDLLLPANGALLNLTPSFQWEPTDDALSGLDHFELWIDDLLVQDDITTESYTLSELQELTSGLHTWTVKAVDLTGIIRQASSTWSFYAAEDNTPPASFNLLAPAHNIWTTQTRPVFSWEASSDQESGLQKYMFYLDGQLEFDSISPTATSTDSITLTQGVHTWHMVAVDSCQNTTASDDTFTIKVDNTPPRQFSLIQPAHDEWITDVTPEFTWQETPDSSIGIGLLEYQLWVDGNLLIDQIPAQTTSISPGSEQALIEGIHTWYVVAEDSLGNSRISQSTFYVKIDTSSPNSFTLNYPEENTYVTDAQPEFSWASTTDDISGLSEYELWLDQTLLKDQLQTNSTIPDLPVDEGTHSWYIRAYDNAGNAEISETFNFTIDTNPPEQFDLILPTNNEVLHINQPSFIWHSTTDDVSGFKKYRLFIDGNIIADNLSIQDTSFTLPNTLENGSYYWKVIASDSAGHERISDYFNFYIDCNPPQITSPDVDTAIEDIPFIYTATATDPEEDPVTLTFHNYPGWLQTSENQIYGTPVEGTPDTSFLIIAYDGLFYDSLKVSLHVQSVNDPPVITSDSTVTATEDIPFSYTATGTDIEGTPLSFSFYNYPEWLYPSENMISGTPTEGVQDTSFLVTASDGGLSDTLLIIVEVIAVNDPPVITSQDSVTATEDILFTYQASASDPENDPIVFSFENYPTWLIPENNLISGIPGEGEQDTCFMLIVSDGDLSDTLEIFLNVIAVNDPPVITSEDSVHATEGTLFTYRANATDVDGPSLSIRFSGYPSWLSTSGPEISGTPGNGQQDTTFTVIASDTYLSDTLVVYLVINSVNDPPSFKYAFPKPVFSDVDTLHWELNLDNYASDPDDPDSTFEWSYAILDTYSVSVSIDPETHVATISGINIQGEFRIVFTVTDPHGASASDTLHINMIITDVYDPNLMAAPSEFVLYDNFPNPFNPFTTIRYGIPRPCHVTIQIYNMLGQEIAVLADDLQTEGMYEVTWNAYNMPTGIYFYRIQAGKWQKVLRMILTK
jgi:hypothetical protein